MIRPDDDRERLSALDKALAVLEVLAEQPQALGLPDLTVRLGLPRQTLHRVLQQLTDNGLVLRDPTRDRFSIGPRFTKLALSALNSGNHSAPARAILADLVEDLQETCNIGVLDGAEFLYLERIECQWSLRVHLPSGSRVPAHCTSGGKVMLAHLDKNVRRNILRAKQLKAYTPNTMTKLNQLEAEFEKIRERGYAVNDQEFTLGIIGLAVPVALDDGRALAALALHGPMPRLARERAEAWVPQMKEVASQLAQVWGLTDGNGDGGASA